MTEAPDKSLRLTSLRLRDFRSYHDYALEGIGNLTIFVGRNGVGKTNILEAIALVTSTQSFRAGQIVQFVSDSAESALICAELSDENRLLTTELSLEPGKKSYRVNGKAKKTADIRGMLPSVAFTPDDLQLVKRSSSMRRDALDNLGLQLSANYYVVRKDYEKVIRYKNRLLKDEASPSLIESINETLLTCGSQLFCYRVALMQRLMPLIASNYSVIAQDGESAPGEGEPVAEGRQEPLQGSYQASWQHLAEEGEVDLSSEHVPHREEVRAKMVQALERFGPQELARKRSLVGPHNDKIFFSLAGRDASLFASQGQQRSLVLAWKLAEVETVRQSTGASPVLLLDDVMSELDATRRDMLVRFVTDDTQTFITATDLSGFNESLLARAQVIRL